MANGPTTGTLRTTQCPAVPIHPWPFYLYRCSNHCAAQIRESDPHTATPIQLYVRDNPSEQIATEKDSPTHPNLMRHLSLLRQQILNLAHGSLVQKRILCPQRQTQRLLHGVKVGRYRYQTRMALADFRVSDLMSRCVDFRASREQ